MGAVRRAPHVVGLWLALLAARSVEASSGVDSLFRMAIDEPVSRKERDIDLGRLERTLLRLSRIVLGADCKHRAAAACLYLNSCGQIAKIVTGFAKINGSFQGHAWVACESGQVFAPTGSNFRVLRTWTQETRPPQ